MSKDLMESNGNLLTLQEVAPRLRMSYSTVYSMARSHALPVLRIGRSWRVPENELNKWISAQIEQVH